MFLTPAPFLYFGSWIVQKLILGYFQLQISFWTVEKRSLNQRPVEYCVPQRSDVPLALNWIHRQNSNCRTRPVSYVPKTAQLKRVSDNTWEAITQIHGARTLPTDAQSMEFGDN